ncbi:MAG: hypothetical protein ACPL68_05230 [Candidatus Hydrothermia bacterium]
MGYLLLVTLASAPLDRGVGLGFIVGLPTGVDVKFWNGSGICPVLVAGINEGDNFHFHGDINLHYPIPAQSVNFLLYYGAGIKAEEEPRDHFVFGPRVPVIGFEMTLYEIPLDFFVEMAPTLEFGGDPDFDFDFEGGIGMRITIK